MTGDYEAVLQVSVRQINGILATFHQNGGEKDRSPHFPHTVPNFRVGKIPKILDPGISSFSGWLGVATQSVRGTGGSTFMHDATPLEIGAYLAEKAPPGAVTRLTDDLRDLIAARDEILEPGRVRGLADIQISTPAVSLERSRVILHVYIRAQYFPEPGTPALPVQIHGEVRVGYEAKPVVKDGKNLLKIIVPEQDSAIQFFPAKNSGPTQAAADAEIAVHIRKALRETFTANPVDLGSNFKFFEFTSLGSFGDLHDHEWRDALGTGDEQALVLPVQLSGNAAPPGAINSVTNLFLGTGQNQDDFAIAISKQYVESMLQPGLDSLRQFQQLVVVPMPDPLEAVNYRVSITSVTLTWNVGWIELKIIGKAITPHTLAPNLESVTITQRLRLVLEPDQSVSLRATDSDLTVSAQLSSTFWISQSDAESLIKTYVVPKLRDPALAPTQADIKKTLAASRADINEALKFKDPDKPDVEPFPVPATARYISVDINPDGILVRGAIDTRYHYMAQPVIDYTRDGLSFSALNCWIPGGRIDKFTWQWVEQAVFKLDSGGGVSKVSSGVLAMPSLFDEYFTIPWEGKVQSAAFYHRFTHAIPPDLKNRPSWAKGVCLTIEGTQVAPDGNVVGVSAGVKSGACTVTAREPLVVLDPITYAIYEILGWPEPPGPVEKLNEKILGHINVLAAHPLESGGARTNTLIYFAGARAGKPMQALGRALGQIRRRDFALTFVIVMPQGAFSSSRREVEERLGLAVQSEEVRGNERAEEIRSDSPPLGFPLPLVITEDYVERWSSVFGARETPASYLVNARGEFVWKQEGEPNPERLAAALDEHLLPSQMHPPRPLRLAVQPGERALDVVFADDRGQRLSVRRLRGRRVLLNFWQSWSEPCMKELRLLQQWHDAGGDDGTVVVAVNGGEDAKLIREARDQHKLTFSLVPDPDQRIARLYGVACWPTTVEINEAGMVNRVQFGITHEHRERDRAQAT